MISQSKQLVLIKNTQNGLNYYSSASNYDDELVILSMYLTSCLGYDSSAAPNIKKWIEKGVAGCNDLYSEIVDGKIQFYHYCLEGMNEPRLSKQELLALIDAWYELVTAKVDKIVITHDDGKFTLSAE